MSMSGDNWKFAAATFEHDTARPSMAMLRRNFILMR